VGGQPTAAFNIDLAEIARASGYRHIYRADTPAALRQVLAEKRDGLTFIEIRVKRGSRADLGRPKTSPAENKAAFMKRFNQLDQIDLLDQTNGRAEGL
jgi:phosphonopyruvate decarboxylase